MSGVSFLIKAIRDAVPVLKPVVYALLDEHVLPREKSLEPFRGVESDPVGDELDLDVLRGGPPGTAFHPHRRVTGGVGPEDFLHFLITHADLDPVIIFLRQIAAGNGQEAQEDEQQNQRDGFRPCHHRLLSAHAMKSHDGVGVFLIKVLR